MGRVEFGLGAGSLTDSPALPKGVQRPKVPVIIGGGDARRTLALAARYPAAAIGRDLTELRSTGISPTSTTWTCSGPRSCPRSSRAVPGVRRSALTW